MSEYRRTSRVASELQAAITRVLQEGLRDPRVTPVTITSVRVSRDLRVAWVGFCPLGGVGDADEIKAGLKAASGYIRRRLAQRSRMRHTPELRFTLDDALEKALDMTEKLKELPIPDPNPVPENES